MGTTGAPTSYAPTGRAVVEACDAHGAPRPACADVLAALEAWVGAQPALQLLNRIGVGSVYAHDVALANRFRAGLGMEPSNSAIVSVADAGAAQRLERAGIVAALRGGRMRASWHLYNTEHDVDLALDALSG